MSTIQVLYEEVKKPSHSSISLFCWMANEWKYHEETQTKYKKKSEKTMSRCYNKALCTL